MPTFTHNHIRVGYMQYVYNIYIHMCTASQKPFSRVNSVVLHAGETETKTDM